MIELVENVDSGARIKVIGAGGCGGNAIDHMISSGLRNVEFGIWWQTGPAAWDDRGR
jgi:cell division protein FtsZ